MQLYENPICNRELISNPSSILDNKPNLQ